jgi:outer membrane lipoprotein SlyB
MRRGCHPVGWFRNGSHGALETGDNRSRLHALIRIYNKETTVRKPASTVILLSAIVFGLSACVAPPPRERVVYHEGGNQSGPRYCHTCGTVRDIDQVEIRQQNSGGGAVIGAIIGGLIGNQFGRGGGRAAATAAGVVGGAVAGNAIEQNDANLRSGYAWRFSVELDDGRWARVTQYDNPGFRPGDRVIINGQRLEFMPRR